MPLYDDLIKRSRSAERVRVRVLPQTHKAVEFADGDIVGDAKAIEALKQVRVIIMHCPTRFETLDSCRNRCCSEYMLYLQTWVWLDCLFGIFSASWVAHSAFNHARAGEGNRSRGEGCGG